MRRGRRGKQMSSQERVLDPDSLTSELHRPELRLGSSGDPSSLPSQKALQPNFVLLCLRNKGFPLGLFRHNHV